MSEWAEVAFVLGVLTLGALVIVAVASQVSAVLRVRTARARDQEYRELAMRAVVTQEQTAAELVALRSRIDALDEILRQVD